MKKLVILLVLLVLGYIGYLFWNKDIMKKDDVFVKDCKNCEYMINDQNVQIKDGIVYIDGNEYRDVNEVKAMKGIILLIKDKAIIGYKEKEVFNFSDGFDTSYPGMKITDIKVENTKIVIQTSRLIDKTTMDIGKTFSICVDGNLNYKALSSSNIDVREPVSITYDVNYTDYKPVASYKETLAMYFKEIGNCKTS